MKIWSKKTYFAWTSLEPITIRAIKYSIDRLDKHANPHVTRWCPEFILRFTMFWQLHHGIASGKWKMGTVSVSICFSTSSLTLSGRRQQPSSPLHGTGVGSRMEALKMLQKGPPACGPRMISFLISKHWKQLNKIGLASSMTKKMQIIFHVQVSKCAFWYMTKITRCGSFKTNDRNHSKAERDNKAARPESLAVAFLARNRQSSCQQTSTVYLFQSMQHMYLFISMFSFLNIKKDMWVPFVPINPIDYVRSCILIQCVFPVALWSVFPHTSLHPNWARSSSKVTLQKFPDQIHSRSTDRVKSTKCSKLVTWLCQVAARSTHAAPTTKPLGHLESSGRPGARRLMIWSSVELTHWHGSERCHCKVTGLHTNRASHLPWNCEAKWVSGMASPQQRGGITTATFQIFEVLTEPSITKLQPSHTSGTIRKPAQNFQMLSDPSNNYTQFVLAFQPAPALP